MREPHYLVSSACNDGSEDDHRPVGDGTIDFKMIKAFILSMSRKPIVTLEPHTDEDIFRTLEGLKKTGIHDALCSFI